MVNHLQGITGDGEHWNTTRDWEITEEHWVVIREHWKTTRDWAGTW